MKYVTVVVLAIIVVALVGCGSVGKTSITSQTSLQISSQSTAAINLKYDTGTRHPNQTDIDNRLYKELSENLINRGIFRSVERNTRDADFLINIRVLKIKVVSPAVRILFGILAGRSQMHAEVDVFKATENEPAISFRVIGGGGSTTIGAESYGYDDIVREVVSQITITLRSYVYTTKSIKRKEIERTENKDRNNIESASDVSETKRSLELRLRRTEELLRQGLITEEEAAAKRTRLLEDL